MFNPELVLVEAGKAIAERPLSPTDRYVLFLRDGHFLCRPASFPVKRLEFLMALSEEQCVVGLSCREWGGLAERILKLIERGVRCQPQSLPSPTKNQKNS